jgi:hypothetical protein
MNTDETIKKRAHAEAQRRREENTFEFEFSAPLRLCVRSVLNDLYASGFYLWQKFPYLSSHDPQ